MPGGEAGAKFAGALNGFRWPPEVEFCASHLVRLKRARRYLDDALLAIECCREQALGTPEWVSRAEHEVRSMRGQCDALIAELRTRLARGFD